MTVFLREILCNFIKGVSGSHTLGISGGLEELHVLFGYQHSGGVP
jgi:hypothetical protein